MSEGGEERERRERVTSTEHSTGAMTPIGHSRNCCASGACALHEGAGGTIWGTTLEAARCCRSLGGGRAGCVDGKRCRLPC